MPERNQSSFPEHPRTPASAGGAVDTAPEGAPLFQRGRDGRPKSSPANVRQAITALGLTATYVGSRRRLAVAGLGAHPETRHLTSGTPTPDLEYAINVVSGLGLAVERVFGFPPISADLVRRVLIVMADERAERSCWKGAVS